MTQLLPDIGRNGLVNSVRRLSGLNNPGFRAVDPSVNFIAGQVAILGADGDGNPVLQVAGAASTTIIGLFYCHKTTSFYRPVVDEVQTFSTSPNTAWVIYLNNANVKASSVKIYNVTQGKATTDFVLSGTNGYITRSSTGSAIIAATDVVRVTYLYEDPTLTGIDQTLGSGMAATLEDWGDVATLVYDTSQTYTIMCNLYANATGYITSYSGGGGSIIGSCTKPPTSDNPELWLKLKI